MPKFTPVSGVSRGFTLIEIVIVLTLMGILAAVVIPEMRGSVEDALLKSECRKWIHVIGLASSHAISRNQTCRLRHLPSQDRYVFEVEKPGQGTRQFEMVREMQGADGRLDPRVKVSIRRTGNSGAGNLRGGGGFASEFSNSNSEAGLVHFYPDGTSEACQIRLEDRMGFSLVLVMNPVTSRLRIADTSSR